MTVEKPTYLLLLVFLGVCIRFDSMSLVLLALAYCLYRVLGKFLSGFLVTRLNPGLQKHPGQLDFGLLAQGGLSLAIFWEYPALYTKR
ncbi:MAG: hypothetical protein R6U40_00245 [Desulfobacterales bacterium]